MLAEVHADAAPGTGIRVEAIGQGPRHVNHICVDEPDGGRRTEPCAGVATVTAPGIYDWGKGDQMFRGRSREVTAGERGQGVVALGPGVGAAGDLVHRGADGLPKEGAAIQHLPRLPGSGDQGPPPRLGPQLHHQESCQPTAIEHPPDRFQMGVDPHHPSPGAAIAIPTTQDQAGHALRPQAQQSTQAQGVDAWQNTGVTNLEHNLAGGIGHHLAPDPMTDRGKAVTDGPLRTGRGAEPTAVAALCVDAKSLVVEYEGGPGTGIDAGPTLRLHQLGMDATLRYDLGRQYIPGIKARGRIKPKPAGSAPIHPGCGQLLR